MSAPYETGPPEREAGRIAGRRHAHNTTLELEIVDRLEAVRLCIDALLAGHWALDEATLDNLSSILHRSALKLRSDRFVRGGR